MSLDQTARTMMTRFSFGDNATDNASVTSSQDERRFADQISESTEVASSVGERTAAKNVGHRLYYVGTIKDRAKQEKLRDRREQVALSEQQQMSQRPNITTRAMQRPAKGMQFADHAQMWREKRDERRREAEYNEVSYQLSQVTGSPSINRKSKAIAEHKEDYSGPVSGWNTHFARFCAKQNTPNVSAAMFSPNINTSSRRLASDNGAPVSSRLYEDAQERIRRQEEAARKQREKERIDPLTEQPLFSPQRLARPTDPATPHSARHFTASTGRSLYEDGAHWEKKRAELAAKWADKEQTHKPQTNADSNQFTKVRKPLYDREAIEAKARAKKGGGVTPERSRSRSPNLSSADSKAFLARNDRFIQKKKEFVSEEQRKREDSVLSECTHHPMISRRSEMLFSQSHYAFASPGADAGGMPPPAEWTPSQGRSARSYQQAQQHYDVMSPPPSYPQDGASHAKSMPQMPSSIPAANASMQSKSSVPSGLQYPSPPQPSAMSEQLQGGAAAPPQQALGNVDDYIQNFEKQMMSVLDEWRKLEDV